MRRRVRARVLSVGARQVRLCICCGVLYLLRSREPAVERGGDEARGQVQQAGSLARGEGDARTPAERTTMSERRFGLSQLRFDAF